MQQVNITVNKSSQNILTLFHLAIAQKRKLKIVYIGMNAKGQTTRVICPYQILFKDRAWYVYAYCEMREERRLFHIARIQEIDLLTAHFHMDDDEAFNHDMCKAFGLFRGSDEYEVKIKFDYPASQWVKEHLWIENQQIEAVENNAIIYSCTVEGLATIERWILRYGDMAQVLEPLELKDRIKETLHRTLARY